MYVLFGLGWVHMRYLGNGWYWFRSYSGSLLKSRNAGPAKSKQKALAPTLGTSPRLGMPVIRPACLTGRLRSKSRFKAKPEPEPEPNWICFSVGAGLSDRRIAAMQTPRYIRHTELMQSQASQLPHLDRDRQKRIGRLPGRRAFAFDLDLRRPVKHAGRTQA